MSKKEEPKVETKIKRNDISVVAEDTNWRTYIAKEQFTANAFFEEWGFLTKAAQGKWKEFLNFCRWSENSHHEGREDCPTRGATQSFKRECLQHL